MTKLPRHSLALFHRLIRVAPLTALALAGPALLPACAQSHVSSSATGVSEPQPAATATFATVSPNDPNQAHMLRTMAKERSVLRQQQIVDETNQLLDLAKQLKAAVDKSSQNQLSLSVVNTATEIEKLAKSVKEKMRDGQ
jgi:selenocysteine lyase/cysteine desulfurase